jgi:hypothetical protein
MQSNNFEKYKKSIFSRNIDNNNIPSDSKYSITLLNNSMDLAADFMKHEYNSEKEFNSIKKQIYYNKNIE